MASKAGEKDSVRIFVMSDFVYKRVRNIFVRANILGRKSRDVQSGIPDAVKETFVKIYGKSLQEELSQRTVKDIDNVCKLL